MKLPVLGQNRNPVLQRRRAAISRSAGSLCSQSSSAKAIQRSVPTPITCIQGKPSKSSGQRLTEVLTSRVPFNSFKRSSQNVAGFRIELTFPHSALLENLRSTIRKVSASSNQHKRLCESIIMAARFRQTAPPVFPGRHQLLIRAILPIHATARPIPRQHLLRRWHFLSPDTCEPPEPSRPRSVTIKGFPDASTSRKYSSIFAFSFPFETVRSSVFMKAP